MRARSTTHQATLRSPHTFHLHPGCHPSHPGTHWATHRASLRFSPIHSSWRSACHLHINLDSRKDSRGAHPPLHAKDYLRKKIRFLSRVAWQPLDSPSCSWPLPRYLKPSIYGPSALYQISDYLGSPRSFSRDRQASYFLAYSPESAKKRCPTNISPY